MSGEFKLANGTLLLSIEAPGGIYNSEQLKKVAALCEAEDAVVKATEDQRIALFVATEKAKSIAEELQAIGLGIRNYQEGLHQPTTCVGEMCENHLQDAMGTSMELTQALAPISLKTPLKIGINGCAQCCVPTHTLDISIIGDMNGYRISLGGKNSQIPEMASFMAEGVPADKCVQLVEKVVNIYADLAEEAETLQDVMERCGSSKFIEALAPYSQDAHGAEDPLAALAGDVAEIEAAEEASDTEDFSDLGADDELNLDDLPDADEFDVADDTSPEEISMGEADSTDMDVDNLEDLSVDDDLEDLKAAEDAFGVAEADLDEATDEVDPVEVEEADEIGVDEIELSSDDSDDFEASEEFDADEVTDDEADAFEEKINASIEEQESFGDAEDLHSEERMEAMQLVESGEFNEDDSSSASGEDFDDLEIDAVSGEKGNVGIWSFSGIDITPDGRLLIQFNSGAEVMIDPSQIPVGQKKDYNLGGQRVLISPDGNGVSVEVDDVGIYLPMRKVG